MVLGSWKLLGDYWGMNAGVMQHFKLLEGLFGSSSLQILETSCAAAVGMTSKALFLLDGVYADGSWKLLEWVSTRASRQFSSF